jgi:hypothetical protein
MAREGRTRRHEYLAEPGGQESAVRQSLTPSEDHQAFKL